MQNPNRTGLRTESEPGKGNPSRIRLRGREPNPVAGCRNRTEYLSGFWARETNRMRASDLETNPNPNPAIASHLQAHISTHSHHDRFPSKGCHCHSQLCFCARSIQCHIGTRSTMSCIIRFTPLCTGGRTAPHPHSWRPRVADAKVMHLQLLHRLYMTLWCDTSIVTRVHGQKPHNHDVHMHRCECSVARGLPVFLTRFLLLRASLRALSARVVS